MTSIACKKCDKIFELPDELPNFHTASKEDMYVFLLVYLHMSKHGINTTKLEDCFHEVQK